MQVCKTKIATGKLLDNPGETTLIDLKHKVFFIECAKQRGILNKGSGYTAHHIRTFCVAGNTLTGGNKGVGKQVCGGGLAICSGNKIHLRIVDILEFGYKIGH